MDRLLSVKNITGGWEPSERAVIVYVRSGRDILLIHKKRGLGKGKINAPGGRIEKGETPAEAAVRECMEETGMIPEAPLLLGVLDFAFTDGYSLAGYVFTADRFSGDMRETPEALPFFCSEERLPYDKMWADDLLWLPYALRGGSFSGKFIFDGDVMIDHELLIFDSKVKLLCFGDSTTWGYDYRDGSRFDKDIRWPGAMKKYLPACFEVTEEGVCGRTVLNYGPEDASGCGIASLRRILEEDTFDRAVLFLGINDLFADREVPLSEIAAGMEKMIHMLRDKNRDIKIYVVSPPPVPDDFEAGYIYGTEINKSLRFAEEYGKIALKNRCSFIDAGKYISAAGTDGIHFDAGMHKLLGMRIADFICREDI